MAWDWFAENLDTAKLDAISERSGPAEVVASVEALMTGHCHRLVVADVNRTPVNYVGVLRSPAPLAAGANVSVWRCADRAACWTSSDLAANSDVAHAVNAWTIGET